jgi:hypothetical protein
MANSTTYTELSEVFAPNLWKQSTFSIGHSPIPKESPAASTSQSVRSRRASAFKMLGKGMGSRTGLGSVTQNKCDQRR